MDRLTFCPLLTQLKNAIQVFFFFFLRFGKRRHVVLQLLGLFSNVPTFFLISNGNLFFSLRRFSTFSAVWHFSSFHVYRFVRFSVLPLSFCCFPKMYDVNFRQSLSGSQCFFCICPRQTSEPYACLFISVSNVLHIVVVNTYSENSSTSFICHGSQPPRTNKRVKTQHNKTFKRSSGFFLKRKFHNASPSLS